MDRPNGKSSEAVQEVHNESPGARQESQRGGSDGDREGFRPSSDHQETEGGPVSPRTI